MKSLTISLIILLLCHCSEQTSTDPEKETEDTVSDIESDSGNDLNTDECSEECEFGCLDGACLDAPASELPGVVQCDVNVVCPSDQICCFDIEKEQGVCQDECEDVENVRGFIKCDGKNDCEEQYDCCAYQYEGNWLYTTCNICKAPVTELLVQKTCVSDDECTGGEKCTILPPTTTSKVCQ